MTRPPQPPATGGTTQVAIVGAGPVGLALAIDLALHGVPCTILSDSQQRARGSRGICWAKRSLEILARLGLGERVLAEAVTWQVSRVFHGDRELYRTDHLAEPGHRMPAFANLQQFRLEDALLDRCRDFPELIDLRFGHRITGIDPGADTIALKVYTEQGRYSLEASYAVACDGARSPLRAALGLSFPGRDFADRFLIADVACDLPGPAERLFWFDPPSHPGSTVLLHQQPGGTLRVEVQLGADADIEAERLPRAVAPRLAKILEGRPFAIREARIYGFSSRRMERFVHGRVLFAGDSAHVMPPFGARGGNGGLHDADNLGWKLAAVVSGRAPAALLDSYDSERSFAADENIGHATRAAQFLVPESPGARALRDTVLTLAATEPFARRLINPGRLSTPSSLAGFPLQSADDPAMMATMGAAMQPGTACADAPVAGGWLLDRLGGDFCLLCIDTAPPAMPKTPCPLRVITIGAGGLGDDAGLVAERYGRGVYLVRPDQHVAARWAAPDPSAVAAALGRACGQP
jgi:3-(3-hydroxy-phenyl)propionate hydroxylase